MILAQKKPLPNSDFAFATVKQVQAKIQQMITLNAGCEPVELDKNEIIALQSSVWILLLSLEAGEQSPETDMLRKQCQLLSALLALPPEQNQRYH